MEKSKLTGLTVKFHKGGKRPRSHGGYSYLSTGIVPAQRVNVLKYLMAARQGLVTDLGPLENDLSTAQIILIDRVVTKLGVLRCIEEHVRETSVIVGQDLAPSLAASYLAYGNSIRLDLQALGLGRRREAILTPYEIVEREKKVEEALT